jgi:voltage-gated potassium channel Kch
MEIFFIAIMISTVYAVSNEKTKLIFAIFLSLPMIVATFADLVENISPDFLNLAKCSGAVFFAYVIVSIIRFVIKQSDVNLDVIYAALVIYLLMGMMWAYVYAILGYFEPGSFNFPSSGIKGDMRYIYFSFVTLTTLGYGDVTPLTSKAASITIMEAVIGQLYLVVQVAWLVGMYTSRSMEKRHHIINVYKKDGKKQSFS